MEFFDEAECWSRDHIEQAQLTRLRNTVAQTRKCDFYRQRLDEAGIGPDSIRSLDDLRRIPGSLSRPQSNMVTPGKIPFACGRPLRAISGTATFLSRDRQPRPVKKKTRPGIGEEGGSSSVAFRGGGKSGQRRLAAQWPRLCPDASKRVNKMCHSIPKPPV